jgi:hypothetical protein
MKPDEKPNLERVLESAIVVSWSDLTRNAQTALIQLEYAFAPTDSGLLESLVIPEPGSLASGLRVLDVSIRIPRHRDPL